MKNWIKAPHESYSMQVISPGCIMNIIEHYRTLSKLTESFERKIRGGGDNYTEIWMSATHNEVKDNLDLDDCGPGRWGGGGKLEKVAILCERFLTQWNRKAAPFTKLSLNWHTRRNRSTFLGCVVLIMTPEILFQLMKYICCERCI